MKWEEHVGVHMKQIGHVLIIVEAEWIRFIKVFSQLLWKEKDLSMFIYFIFFLPDLNNVKLLKILLLLSFFSVVFNNLFYFIF